MTCDSSFMWFNTCQCVSSGNRGLGVAWPRSTNDTVTQCEDLQSGTSMDFQTFWMEACQFCYNLISCRSFNLGIFDFDGFYQPCPGFQFHPSYSMGTSAGYLMLAVVSSRMIPRPLALHWVKHCNSWVVPLYLSCCSHCSMKLRFGTWGQMAGKTYSKWLIWRFWDGLYTNWIQLTIQIGSCKAIPLLHITAPLRPRIRSWLQVLLQAVAFVPNPAVYWYST